MIEPNLREMPATARLVGEAEFSDAIPGAEDGVGFAALLAQRLWRSGALSVELLPLDPKALLNVDLVALRGELQRMVDRVIDGTVDAIHRQVWPDAVGRGSIPGADEPHRSA